MCVFIVCVCVYCVCVCVCVCVYCVFIVCVCVCVCVFYGKRKKNSKIEKKKCVFFMLKTENFEENVSVSKYLLSSLKMRKCLKEGECVIRKKKKGGKREGKCVF